MKTYRRKAWLGEERENISACQRVANDHVSAQAGSMPMRVGTLQVCADMSARAAKLCRVGRYANDLWELGLGSYPYPYHAPVNPTNLVAG